MSGGEVNRKPVKSKSLLAVSLGRLRYSRTFIIGAVILTAIIILCLLAGVICPNGYDHEIIEERFIGPMGKQGIDYLFGTDNLGRSMLARMLYGGRITLLVAMAATVITTVFGTALGAVSGFFGGKADAVIMRILDVVAAIPTLLTAMVISAVLGSGLLNTMIAVSIPNIPGFARMIRGPVLTVKNLEYIEAARSIDAKNPRIIFRHVLPNILSPVIIKTTQGLAAALLSTATLSFLGLGVQPPIPEWGALISAGREFILAYPYLVTIPGCFIALTVFAFNLMGDALRDAFDPRLKN
ncbi:MAG: ABC transporter permease [Lachnospiraceae bacterium]|nr:ABC transporter permease [Lachnospiraceae bacterium]MCI9658569.1 ABC transporter permease [Lachnospiraceae bacterium]